MKIPEFSLVYKENPLAEEVEILREGIINEAVKANMNRMTSFALLMKNPADVIVAGAMGYSMYGFLYVDMLWVDEKFRHKGWGTQLLNAAENLGRERNCRFVCLITMSWQALRFYEKHGYKIEFIREGFDNDTKMYCLRKSLI